MKGMDLYLCGVGGQGIGLLADVLGQAALAAGHRVRGSDTHGLAQRHGTVVSHLRLGEGRHAPRVIPGQADLVVGLERLEALRGAASMLKSGGLVVYYDAVYQPILVRMGKAPYPSAGALARLVTERGGRLERVFIENLGDARMQNVALLGRLAGLAAIPGVTAALIERALRDTLPPRVLDANLAVFRQAVRGD